MERNFNTETYERYSEAVREAAIVAAAMRCNVVVVYTTWAGWQIAPDESRPVERLVKLDDVRAVVLPDGTVRKG